MVGGVPRDGGLYSPAPRGAVIRKGTRSFTFALLFAALVIMGRGLGAPIEGEHYWRQTHVAANIEGYVRDGASLTPHIYNHDTPLRVFDFPAYQLTVSEVSRCLGADPLLTARLVSIVLFVMAVLVLERFMSRTQVAPPVIILCLFFFTSAPLNLFYFRAPMVDDLAVPFALLSLYAYVLWDQDERLGAFLAMVASGILSTLVKSPVYFPISMAIATHRVQRGGLRALLQPALVLYFLLTIATVVAFQLYCHHVNAVSGFLTSGEAHEYFGLVHDRLKAKFWKPIAVTLLAQGVGPVGVVLSLVGVIAYTLRAENTYRSLYLGLGLGTGVTVLVFFEKYVAHSYYCLPLVFPLAYLAAHGTHELLQELAIRGMRYARSLVLLLVVGATLVSSRSGFCSMFLPSTAEMVKDGEWVRLHTHPTDFVFYVVNDENPNWLPALLYFAKRDGYNLPYPQVDTQNLARLERQFSDSNRLFLIFCPDPMFGWLKSQLDSVGSPLAQTEGVGALYALPAEAPSNPGLTRAIVQSPAARTPRPTDIVPAPSSFQGGGSSGQESRAPEE